MRLYIYHRFSTFHINTNKMGIKIHVCLQVLLQGKWRNYKTREIQEWEQNIEEDISAGTIAFQQRKEGKKLSTILLRMAILFIDFISRTYQIQHKSLDCLKRIGSKYGTIGSSPILTKLILRLNKKATLPSYTPPSPAMLSMK